MAASDVNPRRGLGHHQQQLLGRLRRENKLRTLWADWCARAQRGPPPVAPIALAVVRQHLVRGVFCVWDLLVTPTSDDDFVAYFRAVLRALVDASVPYCDRSVLLDFVCLSLQSLEIPALRKQVSQFITISVWDNLRPIERLDVELARAPQLAKLHKTATRRYSKASSPEEKELFDFNKIFLSTLIQQLHILLETYFFATNVDKDKEKQANEDATNYIVRLLKLFCLLETQLSCRRFFHALLRDHLVVELFIRAEKHYTQLAKISKNSITSREQIYTWIKLLRQNYLYEVDELSGHETTYETRIQDSEERLVALQRLIFASHADELRELVMASTWQLQNYNYMSQQLAFASHETVAALCAALELRNVELDNVTLRSRESLVETLIAHVVRLASPDDEMATLPAYPLASVRNVSRAPLVDALLPPLSLQYLGSRDYLFRQSAYYRLESAFAVRLNADECVSRLRPSSRDAFDEEIDRHNSDVDDVDMEKNDDGSASTAANNIKFLGRSRYALPLLSCKVAHVGRVAAFDASPDKVDIEVCYALRDSRYSVNNDWDALSRGEVVFLIHVEVPEPERDADDDISDKDSHARAPFIIREIRGAQVDMVLAYDGISLADAKEDNYDGRKFAPGTRDPRKRNHRLLRLRGDRHQYALDRANSDEMPVDSRYTSFNVLMRRPKRENTSWAVLDCLTQLYGRSGISGTQDDTTASAALPDWLREVYLGYGDPRTTHYSHFADANKQIYFHDTFLNKQHMESAFPGYSVNFSFPCESQTQPTEEIELAIDDEAKSIAVSKPTALGAAARDVFKATLAPENKIPFTKTQVEAIRAGSSKGLTLIVGPPGTGKTDVAVQILCNLYHGKPNERILLLTHSNQALNQLFEKLLHLNHVPERHLLRLGHAEDDMSDHNQYGRISHFMDRRAGFLSRVGYLAQSLGIPGDHAFSCETAHAFFKLHIEPRWYSYVEACCGAKENPVDDGDNNYARNAFPFAVYFASVMPQYESLFSSNKESENGIDAFKVAQQLWGHLLELFTDVRESRPFEVLKSDRFKADLLIAREARIVAMTTTYAALKRRDLVELNFHFDSLIMEEAGTVLEIESFIPLSLSPQVQRVVLIGDHHQLPPVVQCPELQGVTESLFVRMIRLGAPTVQLDQQGRTRRSICELYRHVYDGLGHLPHIVDAMALRANAGFRHEYQFVDVRVGLGVRVPAEEIQPAPHYFQNLAEAEYVVAVYQYMRLLGYPSDSIAILTTYNGQKALIKEVMSKRCAWAPEIFGTCIVTTVDKFQGQQANHVLLSLVRTRSTGHFSDIRRLVVAMSRARLGLYVFGRLELFMSIADLAQTFSLLASRPTELELVQGERFDTKELRSMNQETASVTRIRNVNEMSNLVAHMAQQYQLENM